ncbi:9072_t:CDS:2 [Paraglomus occultum]|uniref:9072_t:CDS:1 n=1 Tax=Paraglomus occultum TaxID=144539 RepID=A0A9N9FYI1_9GLOM|nr:9072_t:CDS:2 [Paraglomus occultum]
MPSDDAAKKRLVSDINTLYNFVKHIQEVDVENVEPLRSIWPLNTSLMMRDDVEKEDVSGEELLKCAERTHGKFYVVDNPKETKASLEYQF